MFMALALREWNRALDINYRKQRWLGRRLKKGGRDKSILFEILEERLFSSVAQ